MEELLKQILTEITGIKGEIIGIKDDIQEIKTIQLRIETNMTDNFKALYAAREVSFDNHKRMEDKIDTIHHELSTIEKVTIKNTADIIDLQSYRKEN